MSKLKIAEILLTAIAALVTAAKALIKLVESISKLKTEPAAS